MRTNFFFVKNGFQNEATLVMKNEKANTWQACHSRHRWCARVLFSFLRWEVLEYEKRNKRKKRRTQLFFSKWFSERGHSRKGKWKSKHVASLLQPPPLMCACSFSISSVGSARIWKMKNMGKKGAPNCFFRNEFHNEATLVMENEKANTWQACYSRHRWCARVLFPFLRWEVLENEKWKKWGKMCTKLFFSKMIFRTRPLS